MDLALNNLQRLICHKTQPTRIAGGIIFINTENGAKKQSSNSSPGYWLIILGMATLNSVFLSIKPIMPSIIYMLKKARI